MGLPSIPVKRYFTIGEVAELCGVKPHVLRYWEQEFTQLRPMKRRGNRRYYQHHEVLMIRRIRDLLYDQGFTIIGARNKLQELVQADRDRRRTTGVSGSSNLLASGGDGHGMSDELVGDVQQVSSCDESCVDDEPDSMPLPASQGQAGADLSRLRRELNEIRDLLSDPY